MSTESHSFVRTHDYANRGVSLRRKGASPVVVLAFIVFLAGLAAWGALIGLKFFTEKQVSALQTDIESFRAEFRSKEVQEMIRSARGLNAANALLGQHHILTPIFLALERSTLPSVKYTNFNYDARAGLLTLGATATNELIFAEQLLVLRDTSIFQTLEFGNPVLHENGSLDFTMTLNVNKADIYPLGPQL